MATFTSDNYDGRYLQLTITESVNAITNTSALTWTLTSMGGTVNYYSIAPTSVIINGTTVYSKGATSWDSEVFPAATGSVGGTITVAHNSNGQKSITVGFSTRVYYSTAQEYGGSMTLTSIDRTAPTVSASATVVSSSSITIKGTANKNCNSWDYSLDGGSAWTNYSTTNGTSASKTLTGLTSKNYTAIKIRAKRADNAVTGISGNASADITLPNISFSVSNITANSVYITASSSITADIWQYSINNGSSWTQFSTTAGTTATKTITGLSPNNTYQIKVQARKKSNGLYGTSAATTVKTLGASVLNSANELVVDVTSPSFNINWTVYDKSYTHSLAIKNGSTTIVTITGLTGSTGTSNKTISLTSTQRTTILNAMASVSSFSATYVLTTYSGSTQIGTTSQIAGTINTSERISAPTFTNFTYSDNNSTIANVTGNSQLFVQLMSSLGVVCSTATAKNGASIAKYTASIGEKTVQSTTPTISFGSISDSGNLTLTVSAVDSRGYKVSISKMITVIDYKTINFDSYAIRRENDVDDTIQLEFSGKMSPITVGSTNKNAFVTAKYRTKLSTATSWSAYTDMTGITSDSSAFEFDNDNWISLPSSDAYYVQLYVSDKLSSKTVTLYVNKGQPLVSYREKKVGINTNDPQFAFDVNGDIAMNGYRVQGFVGTLPADTDLNNVLSSGIYYVPISQTYAHHPQSNSTSVLEVIELTSSFIIQRLTCVNGKTYSRGKYNTTWHDWA